MNFASLDGRQKQDDTFSERGSEEAKGHKMVKRKTAQKTGREKRLRQDKKDRQEGIKRHLGWKKGRMHGK